MSFSSHSQNELKNMNIKENETYLIEYVNKDYFNGEETIEKAKATAILNDGNVYFNVTDPYGMEKLIMNARIID